MMSALPDAQALLKAGDPQGALKLLQNEVRSRASDPKLRVFLFQLLCVLGQWERAATQLELCGELDAGALAMVQTYREALQCEALRKQVFAGTKVPMIFGEPEAWLALLLEALLRDGRGQAGEARQLRDQAFEQAPSRRGTLDGKPFDWIADADMRLGPVLEAVVNGRYYWVPFDRLGRIDIEAPEDLRDSVWMPAHLQFSNGGEAVALVPTRYPGSELSEDGLLNLARKTEWLEPLPEFYTGLGQRVFTTDAGDFSLMDVRSIELQAGEAGVAGEA
jgi:type VI secretion system protein ImpE